MATMANGRVSPGFSLQNKTYGKDQETIQSSITPDPDTTWESNKNTVKPYSQNLHILTLTLTQRS